MEDIIKIRDGYRQNFYKTGNLYYFLIAQEYNKIIDAKLENQNNVTEELSL